ncbi:MAG: hypothetical protein AB7F23_08855 [Phycisphaerae bacterium]|jgi:hypothetical protein
MDEKHTNTEPAPVETAVEKDAGLLADIERLSFELEVSAELYEATPIDFDAAMVLCRDKRGKEPGKSAGEIVSELKNERRYLFNAQPSLRTNSATAPEQDSLIEQAARKAAQSSGASGIMEYMRARRKGH